MKTGELDYLEKKFAIQLVEDHWAETVADSKGNVRLFNSRDEAQEFASEWLTPDFEWLIIAMFVVKIYKTIDDKIFEIDEKENIIREFLRKRDDERIATLKENDEKANCSSCLSNYSHEGEPRFEDLVCHSRVRCNSCGFVYWRVYDSSQVIFDPDDTGLSLDR